MLDFRTENRKFGGGKSSVRVVTGWGKTKIGGKIKRGPIFLGGGEGAAFLERENIQKLFRSREGIDDYCEESSSSQRHRELG